MGSFGISEGNITGRREKKNTHTHTHTQITHLTITPSREVVQTLTSVTSKQGLNREVQAALLRIMNGPECPEYNLRELT